MNHHNKASLFLFGLLALLGAAPTTASAQACPAGRSCFYVPAALPTPPGYTVDWDIVLTSPRGTIAGSYRIGSSATATSFSISPGTPLIVPLSTTEGTASGFNTAESRGLFIEASSQELLVAHRLIIGPWQSSVTVKSSAFGLGTRFRLGGYALNGNTTTDTGYDYVSVYAPFGGTVTFTAPPGAAAGFWDGHAGTTFTATLTAGQTYVARSAPGAVCTREIDGALVTSTDPISVDTGGRGWAGICGAPTGSCGDDGADNLTPTSGVGTQYVVMDFPSPAANGEHTIIVADTDGTQVSVDGTVMATINAGETYQVPDFTAMKHVYYVETSQPAYAYENTGLSACELDLALLPQVALSPTGTWTTDFNLPTRFTGDVGIVISAANVSSIRLDGGATAPTFTSDIAVPTRPDLHAVHFDVTAGDHSVTAGGDFQLGLVTAGGGTGLFGYYTPYRLPGCGDGTKSASEGCDDGNLVDGDGCSSSCKIEVGTTGCTATGDCVPAGRCDAGTCVARCFTDAECNDSNDCTTDSCDGTGACVNAPVAAGGAGSCAAGKICTGAPTNTCVDCLSDAECSGATPVCDTRTHLCVAVVCGDGLLVPGEACDDGNMMAMDGCDASCNIETGWGCSCAAPTFSYSMEMSAGSVGGDGGGAGPQMGCSGNDVLIGLAIQWSDGRGEGVRTKAICGSVSVDAMGAVTTTPTTTQIDGGAGCGGWDPSTWSPDVTCPTGWAVVGMSGTPSSLSGTTTLFTTMNIICQQMGVDGNPAGPTMTLPVTGGGSAGATTQTAMCPANTIARFFQTRRGCAQDALDLFCGVPAVSCSGSGSICATQCGDGVIGAPIEACDDGNAVAGDGCDASCQVEAGWDCATAGAACAPVCGDSMVVGGEACDTGGESATCNADCTTPACGDSILNVAAGEACDDGNMAAGDGCDAMCAPESGWSCGCTAPTFSYSMEMEAGRIGGIGGGVGPQMGCMGNDVLIGLEIEWSDGNGTGTRTTTICGSVSVDASGAVTTTPTTRQSDGGSGCAGWDPSTSSGDVTCPSGWAIVGLTGVRDSDTLFNELSLVCQQMGVDGNPAGPTMTLAVPGGGAGGGTPQTVSCPANTIARYFQTRRGCGQDALDLFCGVPAVSCSGSGSICATQCGDGVIGAPAEACDDGNAVAGDGCDASCQLETGWDCATAGSPCAEICGDSMVVGGEDCDEGGVATATCDADCTAVTCGDSTVNMAAGEECDDGASNSDTDADACRTTCVNPSCGDGVVDTGEGCDEGSANSDAPGATCRTTCALATCGDGVVDTGEECDDGSANADVADACRTTCVSPACGDGIADTGEECDDGVSNSDTTADACRTSCAAASCGDGVVDTGEECDDGAMGSATCTPSCMTIMGMDAGMDAGPDAGGDGGMADAGMDGGDMDGGVDGSSDYGLAGGALCSAPGGQGRGSFPTLLALALGLLVWRRRRR